MPNWRSKQYQVKVKPPKKAVQALTDVEILDSGTEFLVSQAKLDLVADEIGKSAFLLLNEAREKAQLQPARWHRALQLASEVRAKELLVKDDVLRPDGTKGILVPFEFGYPKVNKIELELFGKLSNISVKWLQQHAASEITRALLASINERHFFAEHEVDDMAVGIYIKEEPNQFMLRFNLFCGLDRTALLNNRAHSPKAPANPAATDFSELAQMITQANIYVERNYSAPSWADLLRARDEGLNVYRDIQAPQIAVTYAVDHIKQAISQLQLRK